MAETLYFQGQYGTMGAEEKISGKQTTGPTRCRSFPGE